MVFMIVGLGNPGATYEGTRHNVGFRIVDALARRWTIGFQSRRFPAQWGEGRHDSTKVILVKPQTYMNRSGDAVGPMVRYFQVPRERILVVHDDLDVPFGRIKLVRKGGAGGHRGVASLIEVLGGNDFPRLKVGIGRPRHGESVEAYVLQSFYPDQEEAVERMIHRAVQAAAAVVEEGLDAAMNRFNQRVWSENGAG